MKAVLFDFEGTIVDFQWKLREAVEEAMIELSSLGITVDQENYALLYNESLEIAEELGKYHLVRGRLDEIYDKYDKDALARWKLKQSVPLISRWIRERNIKTALVTNVGRSAIDQALKNFNLNFDLVITRNEMRRLKPSPHGLKKAIEVLKARNAIFVGDSVSDILAAKRTGIPVAVVTDGESEVEEIKKAGPDYILSDLTEIMDIL